MTATELQIVEWSEGRMAITGALPNSRELLERLKPICRMKVEYWAGDSFTFSFASRHRREVVRLLEDFE